MATPQSVTSAKSDRRVAIVRPIGCRALGVSIIMAGLLMATAGQAATVVVAIDGIQPGAARLLVNLCSDGLQPQDCADGQVAFATGPTSVVTFSDVTPGIYAVAAFEDLNGNGVLDRSQNGLPLEPYGFSNNVGRRSTPRFEQAAVRVERDTSIAIHLSSILRRR